jgi:hypothetical protein
MLMGVDKSVAPKAPTDKSFQSLSTTGNQAVTFQSLANRSFCWV